MSWAEKRISLPAFMHRSSSITSHHGGSGGSDLSSSERSNNTSEQVRDIYLDLVKKSYLRKLKYLRRKYFVLYRDNEDDPVRRPAHLEYHDDERKWKAGNPPKRDIVLRKCLNICRKQDSRDSKHKHVIALYTLDDCVGVVFDQEEELQIWLDLLLSHQQGRNIDGKIPKPNYEHMWQVKVRGFQPENKNSGFTMSGPHRMCVTADEVKFFPVGSGDPIVFPVNTLRSCVCGTKDRIFKLETGRSSVSGSGMVIIECEDNEISHNLNVRVLESMRQSGNSGKPPPQRKSTQYNQSERERERERAGAAAGAIAVLGFCRPRSESWSNLDKPALPSSVPTSKLVTNSISSSTTSAKSGAPLSSSSSRYRTTSEGGHFELHKKKKPFISSSPISPGTGSFVCSSESAGSSNSIEEVGSSLDNRLGASVTPDNYGTESVIYEESSAESWVDPEANRKKSGNWTPPERKCNSVVSMVNGSVDCMDVELPSLSESSAAAAKSSSSSTTKGSAATVTSPVESVQYTSIMDTNNASLSTPDDYYMDMTPTGIKESRGTAMTAASAAADLQRLSFVKHNEILTSPSTKQASSGAVTVPSAASSYYDEFQLMSPIWSSAASKAAKDDDEYLTMSPLSASVCRVSNTSGSVSISATTVTTLKGRSVSRGSMDIPLRPIMPSREQQVPLNIGNDYDDANKDSYVTMSPVNVDVDKLKCIAEEPSASRSAIEERLGQSTPVKYRAGKQQQQQQHRSSFCSDGASGVSRWSPGPVWPHAQIDPVEIIDPDSPYVPLNFSAAASSDRYICPIHHHHPQQLAPSTSHHRTSTTSRVSPASSCSVLSGGGTPSSTGETAAFPPEFLQPHKSVSYILRDDERELKEEQLRHRLVELEKQKQRQQQQQSNRTYSVGSRPSSSTALDRPPALPPLPKGGRLSSSSSSTSRFIDIPKSSSFGPSQWIKASSPNSNSGQSPNLVSLIDSWFRHRAGSVPTRPPFLQRRRHRTQSEGEKDNVEEET